MTGRLAASAPAWKAFADNTQPRQAERQQGPGLPVRQRGAGADGAHQPGEAQRHRGGEAEHGAGGGGRQGRAGRAAAPAGPRSAPARRPVPRWRRPAASPAAGHRTGRTTVARQPGTRLSHRPRARSRASPAPAAAVSISPRPAARTADPSPRSGRPARAGRTPGPGPAGRRRRRRARCRPARAGGRPAGQATGRTGRPTSARAEPAGAAARRPRQTSLRRPAPRAPRSRWRRDRSLFPGLPRGTSCRRRAGQQRAGFGRHGGPGAYPRGRQSLAAGKPQRGAMRRSARRLRRDADCGWHRESHDAAPGRPRSGRWRPRRRRARDLPTYSRAQMAPSTAPKMTHGASTIRSLPVTAVVLFSLLPGTT